MLSRRQINVQRENIASMCRISVKSLLDYACLDTNIDDDCEEFINFCAVFEQLVSHRLRPYQKKLWLPGQGSPRHFWDVLVENHNRSRSFLFQSCIPNIEAIEAFKSPKAKLRAFIRVALMEKRLSDYMFWLLDNSSLMCESYLDGALLVSEEAAVLCGDLIGLNAIDFNFCLKGNENELLGPLEISYGPFLRYKQTLASQCSDDIEMLRLSGKEVEEHEHHSSILTESNLNDILRVQNLEKNLGHIKEQKDYLEELVRLQERQLKEAHNKIESMKVERTLSQRDWEQECRTMDGCVLELQAELSNLRKQNESLRIQIASLKQFKQRMEMTEVPMVDMAMAMDRELVRSDTPGEVEPVEDRLNIPRPIRNKKSPPVSLDDRSIMSQVSDGTLYLEDTQSMVPLTGSFLDVSGSTMESETKELSRDGINPLTIPQSGHIVDEKIMKEISAVENFQDQYAEQMLIVQQDGGLSNGDANSTADENRIESGRFEGFEEDSKNGNLEGHQSLMPSDIEEKGGDNLDADATVSESYLMMEKVSQGDATLASLPTKNFEDPCSASGVTKDSTKLGADLARQTGEEHSVNVESGSSSSVESEPEIINTGSTGSDSSDATWEILSDSGNAESKGEN